ncbi:hypothetical protein [Vulcanisaeta sp. JCM 16159]
MGIEHVYAGLTPDEKADVVKELKSKVGAVAWWVMALMMPWL